MLTHHLKTIFPLFALLSIVFSVQAQRPQGNWGGRSQGPTTTGRITGTLIDSVTNQPLEYASVALFSPRSEKAVNGTITDDQGRFRLVEVKVGAYELRISFLGYENKTITNIVTTKQKPALDLGKIMLVPQSVEIDEVMITSEKSLVENKIDRIVYNASQDVTNVGGDAADVLRKVPLLSVDLEGNVSLRGSSNLQILINNKPSGMFSSSIADALKMIPAEEIKSVEVLTVPGAKYDGEGSGGIINIITKKRNVEGISGSVSASGGNRNGNSNASLAYARGRFGINGNGSYRASWPRPGYNTFFRADTLASGEIRILDQEGETFSDWNGFGGRLGAFYDFNAYNSIISSFNYRGRFNGRDATNNASFVDPGAGIDQKYLQTQETFGLFSGYDWNTDYIRTFEEKDKEFSIGVQVSGNINNQDFTLLREGIESSIGDPTLFIDEFSDNRGRNQEITFQTDYTHPFSKKLKLETGAKAILRTIGSDYVYNQRFFGETNYQADDFRSNVFNYEQDVFAGYGQITWNINKKWSTIAGLRYEHTTIGGDFEDEGEPFENMYDNFLPNFILSRKLKGFSNIKISYNQRIQRPSLRFINPFVNSADPRNITVGNPQLDPEVTNQVELAYTTILKGGITLNTAVFYRRTTDVIENILRVNKDGVTETSYLNIADNQSFGLDLFGSIKLFKIWTIRGGGSLYSYDAVGQINGSTVSNTGYIVRLNGSSTLTLPKDFQVEFFGFYRSPRLSLQGSQTSFYIYNFGAKKLLFNKKGSLGVNVIQPFQRNMVFDGDFSGAGFYQMTSFSLPFRSYNANFSYRFGNAKRQKSRRSKLRNNDQKQGETQNF
jgi:outer membrane receptor protein involved in Fe transport